MHRWCFDQVSAVCLPTEELNILQELSPQVSDRSNSSLTVEGASCPIIRVGQYATLTLPMQQIFRDRFVSPDLNIHAKPCKCVWISLIFVNFYYISVTWQWIIRIFRCFLLGCFLAMLMSTPYIGCSEVINRLQIAEIHKYAFKRIIATYFNSLNKYIHNIYQIYPNRH